MVVHRDRLAVDIGLRVALAVLHQPASLVPAGSRRQQREVHPVPAVDRQLPHLPWVDVGGDRRGRRVDERRFSGDCDRFLHSRRGHLRIDHGDLSEQQLHVAVRRRKAGQLHRDAVDASPDGKPEGAALIRDRDKGIARRFIPRRDRHSGKHGARRIGNGAAHRGFLREPGRGHERYNRRRRNHPSQSARPHDDPPWHEVLLNDVLDTIDRLRRRDSISSGSSCRLNRRETESRTVVERPGEV